MDSVVRDDGVVEMVMWCVAEMMMAAVGDDGVVWQWELVEKARSKQLRLHEYNSGTTTLSNVCMFGVDHFDDNLPPGQGAIKKREHGLKFYCTILTHLCVVVGSILATRVTLRPDLLLN
uniref:Dihydrolipoyllysine-residue acetyltransferase component 4 of pyruvate dehydrogenase complex, chloroplastic n=1 Tax=Tanacetum cinerariifolium TaxID=118510 RepID=A0A6L2JCA4_TANCI|nr:dihydrolipoyllysine-residue acetyltransferase component 4 of pyruvate dehydrogenase complex, chloroplastic [Tanacetum cinerariifolium]